MRRRWSAGRLALWITAGAVCAACSVAPSASTPGASASSPVTGKGTLLDLPLPAAVLNAPLVDEHGRTFTLASLQGRTVVLTDFLTTCAEICPMTSVNLSELAQRLSEGGHGADVVVLEGTVDPGQDDPARLLAYKRLFGARADLPGWRLFTAGKGTATFWSALGVAYERTPAEEPAPRDWLTGRKLSYDVEHQDVVFVIDAEGHQRWLVTGNPNTRGAMPPAKLRKFLTDEGQENLTSPASPDWSVADLAAGLEAGSGVRLP